MNTTVSRRWPIWTDGGAGSSQCQVTAPTWVYRVEDGSYLTVLPDGSELASVDRPDTPDGRPIPLQWFRFVARLQAGPATEALIADVEACSGCPDRDLLWRLATALAAHDDAAALLIADGVRVECERGWVGSGGSSRVVRVKATYYL